VVIATVKKKGIDETLLLILLSGHSNKRKNQRQGKGRESKEKGI
jgi:hypothetical protein